MRAQGWAAAEIQRQVNEPNGVGADRFPEYLDAFRAGLKASRQENNLEHAASYRLGICAFQTASLRSQMASQSSAPPQGQRILPKTSAPAPALVTSNTPSRTGFIAPRQAPVVQPLAPAPRKSGGRPASASDESIVAEPRLAMNGEPLITPEDYPITSLRQEEHGVVGFRVAVSASGMPTSCSITSSSGFPALDSQTCALIMQRSRFEPARTASGRAAPAIYQTNVRWTLPD